MSDYIELRSYGKYQHYKDRNPPWVKLYPKMIDHRENGDLTALPVQSRFLAFCMICLAAKTDNMIPANPGWIAAEVGMTASAARKALADLRSIDFIRNFASNGDSGAADNKDIAPLEQRTEVVVAKATPTSRADEVWDTLEQLFGPAPKGSQAHGRRNKAVADLKKFGASPASIIAARKRWDRVFEGATATDIAIATHYGRLVVGTVHDGTTTVTPPCAKCGVGGGHHAADCEDA